MLRAGIVCLAVPLLAAAANFSEHTIASDLRGGYQVVPADLNRDGKPDLIALASGLTELVWFENPGWERHVIPTGMTRMINCVVLESGGVLEIVVASEFANQAKNSIGIVSVLRQSANPREPWSKTEIDPADYIAPPAHRGRGRKRETGGDQRAAHRVQGRGPGISRQGANRVLTGRVGSGSSSAKTTAAWCTASSSPIGMATSTMTS